jgi:hypothetical protein
MRVVIVLCLLLANGLIWAWGQGHLQALGWPAPGTSVAQQTTSQAPDTAPVPVPAAPEPTVAAEPAPAPEAPADPFSNILANTVLPTGCWQARFWAQDQEAALRDILMQASDAIFWRLLPSRLEPRWVVLTPSDANNAGLKQRLKRIGLDFRDTEPPLPTGLIVGTFGTVEGAQSTLAELRARGENGFEVHQVRSEVPVWEIAIYAPNAQTRDTLLEQLGTVPRYSNAELRLTDCADPKQPT